MLANNLFHAASGNQKFYLHNKMSIAATDSTAPTGTATIAAGAAFTATTAVTVSVPATDPGSGMSLVRLSDSPAMTGDVLTTGTTYTYNAAIAWTLPGGDGVKTVYVQWRDAAGNWSAVTSDTITLDTTAPTGTVAINGRCGGDQLRQRELDPDRGGRRRQRGRIRPPLELHGLFRGDADPVRGERPVDADGGRWHQDRVREVRR